MRQKESNLVKPLRIIIVITLFFIVPFIYLLWIGGHLNRMFFANNWATYTSQEFCYSFQYPKQWDLYTSGDEGWHGQVRPFQRAMLLEKPKGYLFGQIAFTVDQVPMDNPTSKDVAAWSLEDRISDSKVAKSSSLDSFIVNKNPALMRTFFADPSHTTEVYIARESDGLILRMTTRAHYHGDALNTFQTITDSFVYEQKCIKDR